MHRFGLQVFMATACLALTAPAALAADGDLDPGYNAGAGYRLDQLAVAPDKTSFSQALGLTADGSAIVSAFAETGSGEGQFTTEKVVPAGTGLDPLFGTAGVRRDQRGYGAHPFSSSGDHLVIGTDGTLLVPGEASDDSGPILSQGDIERYNADGSPLASFAGGSVRHDFGVDHEVSGFTDAVLLADGSVVATGSDAQTATRHETLLVKYTPAGALDTGFNATGIVHAQLATGSDDSFSQRIVAQPDGKLLTISETSGSTAGITTVVKRFNADGSTDTTFGTAGLVHLQVSTLAHPEEKTVPDGLALGADGSIYIGATVSVSVNGPDDDNFEQGVIKLTASGALDPSFGVGGVALHQFALTPPSGKPDSATRDIALTPDGRIVSGGEATDAAGHYQALVTRLLPNGTPDPAFGTGGAVMHQFADAPAPQSQVINLAVAPSGAIVFAGSANRPGAVTNVLVGRLIGNTPPAVAIAPVSASEGVPTTLTASVTDDGTISSTALSWDLNGDGVFGDANGPFATATFTAGPHTVSARATDSYGLSTTASSTFTVAAVPGEIKRLPATGTVKGSTATLALSCVSPQACVGTLTLSSVSGTHAKTARAAKAKPKHKPRKAVSYGKASFRIASGKKASVKVHLTAAARALLAKHSTLSAYLLVTTVSRHTRRTTHRTIVLHGPKPKPKKHAKHKAKHHH